MDWYNADWKYRKKITIDHTKVSGNQTDYPVYIDLSLLGNDFFGNVKSDGSDIVITSSDEVTKLSRELVEIDTTGKTGELYVKSNLSSSVDTVLYIYYGNSSGAETNSTATWNNNYKAVYHMNSADNAQILDSTANARHSTGNSGDTVAGKIGKGTDYDGNEYTQLGFSNASTNFTWQLFFKNTATPSAFTNYIMGDADFNGGNYGSGITFNNPNFYVVNRTANNSDKDLTNCGAIPANGTWQLLHLVINSSSGGKFYQNATQTGSNANATSRNVSITPNIGACGAGLAKYIGDIDEVRILQTAATPELIAVDNANLNNPSTFYSFSEQEGGNKGGMMLFFHNQ